MFRKCLLVLLTIFISMFILTSCTDSQTGTNNDDEIHSPETDDQSQSTETENPTDEETVNMKAKLVIKTGSLDPVYDFIKATSEKTFALFENIPSTVVVNVATVNSTDCGGIVIGYSGETSGLYGEPDASYYYFHRYGGTQIRLSKISNGKTHLIMATNMFATRERLDAELRVVVDGNNIKGYVNDVCYLNYTTEETVEGLKMGLRSDNEGIMYSDIKISPEKEIVTCDIVIFGHSHTECWYSAKEDLASVGKVINAGIGGTIVSHWTSRIDDLTAYGAKKFVVWLGSNDVGVNAPNDVTVDKLNVMFREIVKRVPDAEIYLFTEFYQPAAVRSTDAFRSTILDLNEKYKNSFDGVNIVDIFDVVLKDDGSLNTSLFVDEYHLKVESYGKVADRLIEAMSNPVKVNAETGEERGKYLLGEGSWTITGSDDNLKLVSKSAQNLITFGDKEFNGGTVEFKMKITNSQFNVYGVSGVVFGANDYYVGNYAGTYYCVGQSAWGDLVGFSKALYTSDWEHENKIPQGNLTIGNEYKIKVVWDSENNAIHYFVNDVYRMSTRAKTALCGNKIGFYADNAGVTFSEIRISDKLELDGVNEFYTRGLNEDWVIKTEEINTMFKPTGPSYKTTGDKILMFNKDFGQSDKWLIEYEITNHSKNYINMMGNGIIIGASSPVIDKRDTYVVVGTSYNGELSAYSSEEGKLRWEDSNKVSYYSPLVNYTYKVKFIWDKKAGTLTYYKGNEIIGVQKLSVNLYGNYFGLSTDSDVTIKNISISQIKN